MQDPTKAAILVTGATGFLGGELVRALLAGGVPPAQLRCLVRNPERAAQLGLPAATVRRGDVTDPAGLADAIAGTDVVFHLAGTLKASRPDNYLPVNAAGTGHLVRAALAAAPRCHFVLVSSLAAAGPSIDGAGTDRPPAECRPVSAYGASKRLGELAVAGSALAWTIVRPPVVYGPGDAATRLLFKQACAPLCLVPPRPQPLSVMHVDDVVQALLAVARARPAGAVLPLDGAQRTDTHALLRAIAAACGRQARLLPVPLALAAAAASVCDLFARMSGRAGFFNGDKIKELRAAGWVADGRLARQLPGLPPAIALADGLAAVARAEGRLPPRSAATSGAA